MKKLYIVLIALFTFITLPGLQTQAYSYTGNDIAITELNGLTLNELFRDSELDNNGDFSTNPLSAWGTAGSTESYDSINNYLINTGDGTLSFVYANRNYSFTVGDTYYLRSKTRVTNSNAIALTLRFDANNLDTMSNPTQNIWYELSALRTTTANTSVLLVHNYNNGPDANGSVMEADYIFIYNLTTLGITTTQDVLDYWFNQWQENNIYIEAYNQGELDGYAEGLADNTAYVQGYNVGYTDGLTEAVDMETGSSIIVLVLAALSFGFMIFGFSSKKRIFNLFAAGLFIVLGGLLIEFAAFIIITIGFVIFNLYYTFVSD